MGKYPWYAVVDDKEPLLQGDFINSCPVVIPPAIIKLENVSAEVIEYDVTIMSQSCDLEQRKIDLVLVCPFWSLTEFEKRSDFFKSRRGKEALRQGNVPGYHLLNKCEIDGFETDFLIIDFRSVYSVPFGFIFNLVRKVVQELVGHSRISTTADIYSYVSPELKHSAVSKLNGLFTL